jgi:quercetin dioxygenase-like cupin family protein/hemerythrin-like domain-containing protein
MREAEPRDPIAILLDEHRAAEAVFASFEQALAATARGGAAIRPAVDAARAMLAYLDGALEVHIRKEEEPLFPRLKARLPADDRYVEELVAEHDQARIRREELRQMLDSLLAGEDHDELRQGREALRAAAAAYGPDGPAAADLSALRAAGRVLLRTLRVHFQNEEELAFPLAKDLLAAEELSAAGWEMQVIDQEVKAMAEQEQGRSRPAGETSGSPQRPAQRMAGPLLRFDLAAELAQLHQEPSWQRGDRNAKTLVRQPDFRIVLTAMKAGARLAEHGAPGRLSIQTMQGRLHVRLGDDQIQLATGDLLALEQGIRHEVTAIEESAFLLTIAWPVGRASD